jgi:hypothetical protein
MYSSPTPPALTFYQEPGDAIPLLPSERGRRPDALCIARTVHLHAAVPDDMVWYVEATSPAPRGPQRRAMS